MIRTVALVAALLLLAGCGPEGTAGTSRAATPSPERVAPDETVVDRSDPGAAAPELVGTGTVLEHRDGPHLCLGAVATSYPPQCGGPRITRWDWAAVADSVSAAGVRWGDYVVIGRYDAAAGTFTLTGPVQTREEYDGPTLDAPEDDLATPCPAPPGGWLPVDPARATQRAFDETARRARRFDGFADLWIDQSINPADASAHPERVNDPALFVLNVRVTGDTAEARRTLRETWGGALCVNAAKRSDRELRTVRRALEGLPGLLLLSHGRDRVTAEVVHDDGTLQRRFDARYGAGVVEVRSALRPFTPPARGSG